MTRHLHDHICAAGSKLPADVNAAYSRTTSQPSPSHHVHLANKLAYAYICLDASDTRLVTHHLFSPNPFTFPFLLVRYHLHFVSSMQLPMYIYSTYWPKGKIPGVTGE